MILDALYAAAIFAGIACVISIPWMIGPEGESEHH